MIRQKWTPELCVKIPAPFKARCSSCSRPLQLNSQHLLVKTLEFVFSPPQLPLPRTRLSEGRLADESVCSVKDSGKRNELKSVFVVHEIEDAGNGVQNEGLLGLCVDKPGRRRATHTRAMMCV